ncbi:DUF116 domain-containing protein [Thermodesulfobacteriota bacterium]
MPCFHKDGRHDRIAKLFVLLNNWSRSRKSFAIDPANILLLLPRCLQFSDCPRNITKDVGKCERCGRCKIKDIVEMAEELGVRLFVATGGRLAQAKVLRSEIHAVVAVACERELRAGLRACPKPVIAVTNLRPNGPCLDTDVDLEAIRGAILQLMGRL